MFSFPPDKGNVGTAAYLNVFASIFSVLNDLKNDGYNVEGLPETPELLIEVCGSLGPGQRTAVIFSPSCMAGVW